MPVGMSVTHDLSSARSLLGQMDKLQRRAAISALSRTGQQVRTEARRKIREQFPGMKAGVINRALKLDRSRVANIQIAVTSNGRRIQVIDTAAKQTRRGVTVRIGKSRKLIKGAFVATMRSGHVGVFRRKGKARLPIQEVFTISVSEAFSSRIVVEAMRAKAEDVFLPRFRHELERLAQSAGRGIVQ